MSFYPNDTKPLSGWQHPFLRGLADLRQQTDSSDLTIICGTTTHRVHKLVLGLQSEYFKTACKPDTFSEGQSHIITLKSINDRDDTEGADDPAAVDAMIDFFYGVETYYLVDQWGNTGLPHLAGLYIVADKYRVTGMREDILRHFRRALEESRSGDGNALCKLLRTLWDNLPSADDPILTVLVEFIVCCKSHVLRKKDMEELVHAEHQVAKKFLGVFVKWCAWPAKNRRSEGAPGLTPEAGFRESRSSESLRWDRPSVPNCRCEDSWEKMMNPPPPPKAKVDEPTEQNTGW
ncbi:hypothetical protein BDZ85DRAFT_282855 [Elsinoe ampelina]|uniref:BTB domain-containing protein n=1 Tax=Elsinoe ampelina TaxID=302913 RepID=A0A6A6G802_9PEZI|nr:hypothetical protein BDZ85DRAFT_282855 [Elsinoe ampelina]